MAASTIRRHCLMLDIITTHMHSPGHSGPNTSVPGRCPQVSPGPNEGSYSSMSAWPGFNSTLKTVLLLAG